MKKYTLVEARQEILISRGESNADIVASPGMVPIAEFIENDGLQQPGCCKSRPGRVGIGSFSQTIGRHNKERN